MIIKKKNRNHSVIRCKFRKECLNLSDSQREKLTINCEQESEQIRKQISWEKRNDDAQRD